MSDVPRLRRAVLAGAACLICAVVALVPDSVAASWWEVVEADADLDLERAAERALATVAAEPQGADAVAAAGWWLDNLDELAAAEAMVLAGSGARDPELAYLLARIEAAVHGRAPAGTLTRAEMAGPFGVFDTLDLERQVVPGDSELPPLATTVSRSRAPFRLALGNATGWFGPADSLIQSGVYLVAWSFAVSSPCSGWLVVEAEGSLDLELDGAPVARLRDCGRTDPALSWFGIELGAGCHRLRAAIASPDLPRVRLTLLDRNGAPLDVDLTPGSCVSQAASRLESAPPPAAAALDGRLSAADPELRTLLLAAALASQRGDAVSEREWLRRALELAPEDPWPHLGLARFYLVEPTGAAPEVDLIRAQDHLRSCRELPISLLLELSLARRQHRDEDAERTLDALVEQFPNDVRVLKAWVEEAVRLGWAREAADGLARMEALLPGSRGVAELRLAVLASLERWQEHNRALSALAGEPLVTVELARRLSSRCCADDAAAVLARLGKRCDDPDLDVAAIRLLIDTGEVVQAAARIDQARRRWGELYALDHLALILAAGDETALSRELDGALAAYPSDLQLRTLAWRRGREPFFAPYRVDAAELAAREQEELEGVDAVLLLDQAVERIYADGSSIYYYHGLTRALTPAGARQATVLQQLDDAVLLRVRVLKPDGEAAVPPELRRSEGQTVLGDVYPGDLVEEEYVMGVAPSPTSGRGHLPPYIFRFADRERAFGLSEYVLLVPADVEIEIEGRFDGLQREEWDDGDLHVMRWRAERVPPMPSEPLAPPTQELLPWVTYGFGVSWQEVGDAVRDRVLRVIRAPPELVEWSEPLLREGGEEGVRRLVEALVDAVEPGRTALDLGATVGESFSRRRGNRIAIAAAALMVAGWEVDVVLTRPLPLSGTHLAVPTMDAFFMPLLRVTREGSTLWLDLDEERRGVNHVNPVVQGSDALILPISDPRAPVDYCGRLPSFANPELEERVAISAVLSTSGDAHVAVEMRVLGAHGERMLERLGSVPQDRVGTVYRQLAVSLFPAADNVRGDLGRRGEAVVLSLELDLPEACDITDASMTCRHLVVAKPLAPLLASLAERRFPLVLQLPILQQTELELVVPSGWSPHWQPRRFSTDWGSVSETVEAEGARVHSVLDLRVDAQVIAPEEYSEFALFCHAVDELISRPPVLRRVY